MDAEYSFDEAIGYIKKNGTQAVALQFHTSLLRVSV